MVKAKKVLMKQIRPRVILLYDKNLEDEHNILLKNK